MEIFCTTNLITLLFAKKLNLFYTKQLLQLMEQFKVLYKKNLWTKWVLKQLNPKDGWEGSVCMCKIINIGILKYLTDLKYLNVKLVAVLDVETNLF